MPYIFSLHLSCREILICLGFLTLFVDFTHGLHGYSIDIWTNRRVYWISQIEKCINLICVLSHFSSLMQSEGWCQFNQSWITTTTTCQRALDYIQLIWLATFWLNDSSFPDSEVDGAYMGPTWGRQDPGAPHVGPMLLIIWVVLTHWGWHKRPTFFGLRFKIHLTERKILYFDWNYPEVFVYSLAPNWQKQ